MNKKEKLLHEIISYKAFISANQANWEKVETNADINRLIKSEEKALNRVKRAFHDVTKKFNSIESCNRLDVEFMGRIAPKL